MVVCECFVRFVSTKSNEEKPRIFTRQTRITTYEKAVNKVKLCNNAVLVLNTSEFDCFDVK